MDPRRLSDRPRVRARRVGVRRVSVSFSREGLGVCSWPKGEEAARSLGAGETFGSVSKPALFFLPLPIDIREAV